MNEIEQELEYWKLLERDARQRLDHYQKHEEFWQKRLEEAEDMVEELESRLAVCLPKERKE